MNKDIKRKRAILLTTKLRFSPDVQPKKESAIDKIIEQTLPFDKNKIGLTQHEIKNIIYSESGSHILDNEIKNSITRLIKEERIISERDKENNISYKLSEETYLEIEKMKQQAEDTFNSIVGRLFKNVKEGYKAYFDPFLEFLCIVFSSLGDEYVKILTGAFKKSDLFKEYGIKDYERHTVTYCQYGDTRMKPTDIWTNCKEWKSKSPCKNGSPCHVAAPRGSRTGTQGIKGAKNRGIIPPEIFHEIFTHITVKEKLE